MIEPLQLALDLIIGIPGPVVITITVNVVVRALREGQRDGAKDGLRWELELVVRARLIPILQAEQSGSPAPKRGPRDIRHHTGGAHSVVELRHDHSNLARASLGIGVCSSLCLLEKGKAARRVHIQESP